jgi:single-strand DNA-binding protein
MSEKNRVVLKGNVLFDPMVTEVAPGRKVARFAIATKEEYASPTGETVTDTQHHNVVAWGSNADKVENIVRLGKKFTVEGRLVHRSYDNGHGTTRYTSEVVLTSIEPL